MGYSFITTTEGGSANCEQKNMDTGWKSRRLQTACKWRPGSKFWGRTEGEKAEPNGRGATVEESEGLGGDWGRFSGSESNTPLTIVGFLKHPRSYLC